MHFYVHNIIYAHFYVHIILCSLSFSLLLPLLCSIFRFNFMSTLSFLYKLFMLVSFISYCFNCGMNDLGLNDVDYSS